MNYIEIFRTSQRNELSIVKNLFDQEDISYRTHGEAMDSAANIGGLGNGGLRMEVSEDDFKAASKLIERTGFFGQKNNREQTQTKKNIPILGKRLSMLMTALVVFIVVILLLWL